MVRAVSSECLGIDDHVGALSGDPVYCGPEYLCTETGTGPA